MTTRSTRRTVGCVICESCVGVGKAWRTVETQVLKALWFCAGKVMSVFGEDARRPSAEEGGSVAREALRWL